MQCGLVMMGQSMIGLVMIGQRCCTYWINGTDGGLYNVTKDV